MHKIGSRPGKNPDIGGGAGDGEVKGPLGRLIRAVQGDRGGGRGGLGNN